MSREHVAEHRSSWDQLRCLAGACRNGLCADCTSAPARVVGKAGKAPSVTAVTAGADADHVEPLITTRQDTSGLRDARHATVPPRRSVGALQALSVLLADASRTAAMSGEALCYAVQ